MSGAIVLQVLAVRKYLVSGSNWHSELSIGRIATWLLLSSRQSWIVETSRISSIVPFALPVQWVVHFVHGRLVLLTSSLHTGYVQAPISVLTCHIDTAPSAWLATRWVIDFVVFFTWFTYHWKFLENEEDTRDLRRAMPPTYSSRRRLYYIILINRFPSLNLTENAQSNQLNQSTHVECNIHSGWG
jgi:hypothetical protein